MLLSIRQDRLLLSPSEVWALADPSMESREAEVTFQAEKHRLEFPGTFPRLSTLAISRRPAAMRRMALNQTIYKASKSTILL